MPVVNEVVGMSDDVVAKLTAESQTLYRQNGKLVDVEFVKGAVVVEKVSKPRLAVRIREHFDMSEKNIGQVASHVLHSPDHVGKFRPLGNTFSSPTFRSDFTLIPPGYDELTHSLYIPPRGFSEYMPNLDATTEDARDAFKKLLYPFHDFPLATEADRTNALAFLLTLVCHTAIDAYIPTLLLSASAMGQSSGKGLLTTTLSYIATGHDAKTQSYSANKNEFSSHLQANLLRGESFIVIDNITGRFSSDEFASIVTSKSRLVRIKGTSNVVDTESKAVYLLNGNDVKLSRDTSERVIFCDLWHPDPKNRDRNEFQVMKDHGVTLDRYIERNWLEYYDACMTVIQAWRNAGMPKRKESVLAKYQVWEGIIGGMLELVGANEFLTNQFRKQDEADEETAEIVKFLEWLVGRFPDITGYQGELMGTIAKAHEEWSALLPVVSGRGSDEIAVSLGKWVAAHKGLHFGNWSIETKRGKNVFGGGQGSWLRLVPVRK